MIRPRLTRPTESVPASPPRPYYIAGRVIVRVREDVSSQAPDLATARPETVKALTLPEQVEEPFRGLRQQRTIKEVVPIFARPTALLPQTQGAAAVAVPLVASVQYSESDDLRGINLLEIAKSADVEKVASELRRSPGIEYAEPVPARWATASRKQGSKKKGTSEAPEPMATDPMFNRQWGLRAIRWFGKSLPDSSSVRVAVLDTGIDEDHPDLGFRFTYTYTGAKSEDIVGHGTHVTGILAAITNNQNGVAGVCRCDLRVWKIFGDEPFEDGEYYVDEVMYQRALNDARTHGVQVLNLSIGSRVFTKTEEILIRRLIESNCVVVAAMGNEHEQGNPVEYPAAHTNVVAVGAVNEANRRAAFSNTGAHISLVAPGTNILSLLPMKKSAYRNEEETEYGAWSGTSMATPHVTGAVALLRAKEPNLSPVEVAERLMGKAAKLPGMKTKRTAALGSGLLDVSALW